jgi:hypothetical protein
MTNPSRSTPLLIASSAVLAVLVVGAILLVGGCGADGTPSAGSPSTTPTTMPPAASASPTGPTATPGDAVRAFFAAYAAARTSGDAVGLRDLVTSEDAPAFLTIKGFLDGQTAAGKASVVTEQRLDNIVTEIDGTTATVTFDLTEAGYDIGLADASPLESPQVLPARRVTVTLERVGDRWLVDAFESSQ